MRFRGYLQDILSFSSALPRPNKIPEASVVLVVDVTWQPSTPIDINVSRHCLSYHSRLWKKKWNMWARPTSGKYILEAIQRMNHISVTKQYACEQMQISWNRFCVLIEESVLTVHLSPSQIVPQNWVSRVTNSSSVKRRGTLKFSVWEILRPVHHIRWCKERAYNGD